MKKSVLRRSKGVRKRNPARRASEFKRCYGSKARVEFVKSLPCCLSTVSNMCNEPIHNAHIKTGGMGRKADASLIVPLCQWHHSVLHAIGNGLWQCYGINPESCAERTRVAWSEHIGERLNGE